MFYLWLVQKLVSIKTTTIRILNASSSITAWVCGFLAGAGGRISTFDRRIALMQRRDNDDEHPISSYCQTSLAQGAFHDDQSQPARGGIRSMDDWSFPCGLKINGRGLLISGIDCQVVAPGEPLHLSWGKKRTGKWTGPLFVGQSGYLVSKLVLLRRPSGTALQEPSTRLF